VGTFAISQSSDGEGMIAKRTSSFKKRGLRTRRSKLETYTDILKVLINRGPLKTTHIMQKINVNSKTFKEYVEFLIKQGLVEERFVKEGRIVYEITPRGVLILKSLKELEKVVLPSDKALTRGQSTKGVNFL
jgi:predicted transcriptional regulator